MAIKSGVFYWLVCDKCGVDFRDEECRTIVYHEDIGWLLNEAEYEDWLLEDNRHLCPDCADAEEFGTEG